MFEETISQVQYYQVSTIKKIQLVMIHHYLTSAKNYQIAEFFHKSTAITKMFESLKNNPDGDQVTKLCMLVQFFGFNHLNMYQIE
jgi:hypothetical protein